MGYFELNKNGDFVLTDNGKSVKEELVMFGNIK
ncbi:hypothetical protein Desaci_3032 [Desulfosporosinus acidiphilus SJ4]|uniref:Uncharacterized protein n=1 Tax=Desulfosporosinus acidiphilus (strain DSM 22704 / JCM 16185 / SJ4) TaxID=646529 RepID=I4D816_DESAJ|nr:hypothetical protein Desaci_3032 [Desulfosporosinus acidiphilus SJ4]